MTSNSNLNNLNSHYSSQTKVEIPQRVVVSGPTALSGQHVYNDIDAKKRMRAINDDIYQSAKVQKTQENRKFLKVFCGIVLTIFAALGVKRFFK